MCAQASSPSRKKAGTWFYLQPARERMWEKCPLALTNPGMIVVITCMHSDQKLDPLAEVYKVCNPTPSRERLGDGHFFCSPCASPGVIAMTNAHLPVNNCCLPQCGGLLHSSLIDICRARSGVTDVWHSPSLLRVKLELEVFCQVYDSMPGMGFMARMCLSLSFLYQGGCFFGHLMYKSHRAGFWVSLRGNRSMHSIFSGSVAGEKFRILLSCYLRDVPLELYFS